MKKILIISPIFHSEETETQKKKAVYPVSHI